MQDEKDLKLAEYHRSVVELGGEQVVLFLESVLYLLNRMQAWAWSYLLLVLPEIEQPQLHDPSPNPNPRL